ncbi:MAG: hypothetical protein K0R12_1254 [Gammaproteobacteria bacterium]|nr:hypothetical protein [Gammaproteobacteria bacterium]
MEPLKSIGNSVDKGSLSFPLNCTDPTPYISHIGALSLVPKCNGDGVIFAVCEEGTSCGSLPANPQSKVGQTINGWLITREPPHQTTWDPITKSVLLKGSCDLNTTDNQYHCSWPVKSLGPDGLLDTVVSDLSWNLYSSKESDYYDKDPLITPLGLQIYPYHYARASNPTLEKIKWKQRSEGTKEPIEALLPFEVSQDAPVWLDTIPQKTAVYGGCNTAGQCRYRFVGYATVTAMPWGNYDNPNCAGFTPEQMALLNWSQMDFSEYTDSLTIQDDPREKSQKKSRSNEDPSNALKAQSQALVEAMQSGTPVEIASPTRAHNRPIIVTPREIQGPADVSLIAAPFWLETPLGQNRQEAVQSVQIDWGDGSKQLLESPNLGPDHAVTHHYGMAPKHNIETVITSVFTLKNGHLHVVKTYIKNYWSQ